MRGFNFRLDSVLKLRRHREESLQRRLADLQRTLDQETARLKSIEDERRIQVERLATQQETGPLDVHSLWLSSSYLMELELRLQHQARLVDALNKDVADAREAVIRASQDKKALETMREGLLQTYEKEATRKEQKVADEVATTRHLLRHKAT